MKTAEDENGTVIEFLLGEKSFDGVWFGDVNPNDKRQFWWRKHLREYLSQFKTVEPEKESFCECSGQKDSDCKYCTACNRFHSI